jgi:protein associated with RNAse G/E
VSYKAKANEVLIQAYKANGFLHTLSLCEKILQSQHLLEVADVQDRNTVAGELCETVLEMSILEYKRKYPNKTSSWRYSKGLILKDIENPNGRFLTEIDMALFTPHAAFLFECKCYSGDKRVLGRGEIVRSKGRRFDVYNQHINHAKVFVNTFDRFKKEGTPERTAYRLAVFNFSPGSLVDQRSTEWVNFLPFVGVEETTKLFDSLNYKTRIWNMEYVSKAVDLIEKKKDTYIAKHLEYVKSLRSKHS